MARIAESAKSSPNRRSFLAIINCSAQLCSTRSTTKGVGVYWEKAEGGCQNRTKSSLVYVSEDSRYRRLVEVGRKIGV